MRCRHSIVVAAGLGTLIVVGALLWNIATAEEGMLLRMGTIITAEERNLVIRDEKNDKHTFAVPADAEITLNRRVADMKDLKPGYFARVSAKWSAETLVALMIEAAAEETESR